MDVKWYVVYTKPGSEQKVSEVLKRKKLENYCPVYSVPKKYGDNSKVKETPLFKGYVFVKISELQHQELKKINGVINMVYWLGKPVSVTSVEIKAIKFFLGDYTNITIEKTEIKSNDRINTQSNLSGHEGPLVTIKNKKAGVVLPSLGYILTAEVETLNVRIISSEGISNQPDSKTSKLFDRVSEFNNSLKDYWTKALMISMYILALTR